MRVFRRVMLGGGIDIDIDALPDTHKIYYKATYKVKPIANALDAPQIANKWDATTNEGIIVCSRDITTIGNNAFSDHGLTSITIPDTVTSIGISAFHNCYRLKSVTIGNGLTSIGQSAFNSCFNLTSITIPDNITSINRYTFNSCYALTSVTIGNGVTSIGDYAFAYCKSLTSVTIPNNVSEIGSSAFRDCASMQYYDFSTHESLPTLADTYAFYNIPSSCKIIVPDALYDEWIATTNWSTYASRIIKKSDWDASQTTE